MKPLITYLVLFGLFLTSPSLGGERELELLEQAGTGKDGAFEVMSEFAECSGLYEASSEYSGELEGGKALAENLQGYANGARVVAWYFWRTFSKRPMLAVEGVQGAAKLRYAALLESEGPAGVGFRATMAACDANLGLQALIIKEMRKNY